MQLPRALRASIPLAIASTLSSCSYFSKEPQLGEIKRVSYTIDSAATILPAEYGKSYLLEGNFVARYPDFDLVKVRSEIVTAGHLKKTAGHYDTFELREHSGKPIKRILIDPDDGYKSMRFKLYNQSYLINRGTLPGSISIHIPPHLLV